MITSDTLANWESRLDALIPKVCAAAPEESANAATLDLQEELKDIVRDIRDEYLELLRREALGDG